MSHTLASSGVRRPSSAAAPQSAATRGASRPPRPTLRVVRAPAAERGRTLFVACCLLLLVGGLLTLLLINTALAQGSFTLQRLQQTSAGLGDRNQALRQDIAVQAAPPQLAARATALGMVPSDSAAFLRLSDGKVLGVARPATAPPTPTPTPTGTAKPSGTAKPEPGGTPSGQGQPATGQPQATATR